MTDLYIGLMSGTSMDGIDAALVRFGADGIELLATYQQEYPASLREQLAAASNDTTLRSVADVANLHRQVGLAFAATAATLLAAAGVEASAVTAIGSHGQTVRHEPNAARPFSLQLGDGALIAAETGITTVCDFRTADIELGGQGAPLAPAFHDWLFRRPDTRRAVLNIGGIANVTLLPADTAATTGFDTGPGNTLLDAWCRLHTGAAYDRDGEWAAQGTADPALLERLLADSYFAAAPPKSTGFEYFNVAWLRSFELGKTRPVDVQATLCALTAESVAAAIRGNADEVFVCGGGVHNPELMRRLGDALPDVDIATTAALGLDPDWVEAVAFAWLAMRRNSELPGNLPSVTGASRAAMLGVIHAPG